MHQFFKDGEQCAARAFTVVELLADGDRTP
jgi:hypothetical protein